MGVRTEPKMKIRLRLAIATEDVGISLTTRPGAGRLTRSQIGLLQSGRHMTATGVVRAPTSHGCQLIYVSNSGGRPNNFFWPSTRVPPPSLAALGRQRFCKLSAKLI